MFDIGFWELIVIGVVGLLVIGPERMPAVARGIGVWVGRARRFIGSIKADIDQELKAEELKRIMQEQQNSIGLHEIIEETEGELRDLGKSDYVVKAQPSEQPAELPQSNPERNEQP